ncbi:MAG TPA: cellulose biosynthesis protein BcsS [Geomonas sp.]|nr:cellulose biosynthesis protein BcsS [Geomonas sp.]
MKATGNQAKAARGLLLTVLALLLMAAPAAARDLLLFSGAEGGGGGGTSTENYYTYLGVVTPLLDKAFGPGFMQKYKVDFLGYSYPVNNQDITATGVGVEASLGYQFGGEHGWGGGYAGARYSHTWLSPDDPKSEVRGSQLRPLVQLEGERILNEDWKLNGLGSYLFISDAYWARGRVMYRAFDKVYTGPEFTAQGDPSYNAWSGGWFITGFRPAAKSELGFKAGARKVENGNTGVYLGIDFSHMF